MLSKGQKERRTEAKTRRQEIRTARVATKAERDKAKVAWKRQRNEDRSAKNKANLDLRKQGKPTHGLSVGVWRKKPRKKRKRLWNRKKKKE